MAVVGLAINGNYDTIDGMWWAIVPVALLNQNFSVAKGTLSAPNSSHVPAGHTPLVVRLALSLPLIISSLAALVTDYIDEQGGTDADRAGAVGKLGMAVGFAFMAGPVCAAMLVTDYTQALKLSAAGMVISACFLLLLPRPTGVRAFSTSPAAVAPGGGGLLGFVSMPVLQTRGAQLLMAVRLLMAFAFHMFAPLWQVSIKRRFDFQPADHAKFMGLIGLTYALSQGLVAKPLIRRSGSDPSKLLLACILVLGGSRPFALWTSSVRIVCMLYVPMVVSLGVMNTAITTACSRLAEGDQLGGLFGVLESVESLAGIVGPSLGGILAKQYDEMGTLTAVVCCYGAAFLLVLLFFGKHVVHAAESEKAKVA